MTGVALNLVLESNPKNIAEVEPYVMQVVREYNLGDQIFGNMLITLTEAVSNAIIHGNRARVHKKVHVHTTCTNQKVRFIIQDEGQGFNPDALPDPTAPENLLTPGGRGVFLMRQLADHLEFHDEGRKVEIEFNL